MQGGGKRQITRLREQIKRRGRCGSHTDVLSDLLFASPTLPARTASRRAQQAGVHPKLLYTPLTHNTHTLQAIDCEGRLTSACYGQNHASFNGTDYCSHFAFYGRKRAVFSRAVSSVITHAPPSITAQKVGFWTATPSAILLNESGYGRICATQ